MSEPELHYGIITFTNTGELPVANYNLFKFQDKETRDEYHIKMGSKEGKLMKEHCMFFEKSCGINKDLRRTICVHDLVYEAKDGSLTTFEGIWDSYPVSEENIKSICMVKKVIKE